jgi:hypothetical protein
VGPTRAQLPDHHDRTGQGLAAHVRGGIWRRTRYPTLIRRLDARRVGSRGETRHAEAASAWMIGTSLDMRAFSPAAVQLCQGSDRAGKSADRPRISPYWGASVFRSARTRGRTAFRMPFCSMHGTACARLPEQGVSDATLRIHHGDMVHRALRAWLMPTQMEPDDLEARLQRMPGSRISASRTGPAGGRAGGGIC